MKKFLSLALCVIMLFSLVSCLPEDDTSGSGGSGKSSGSTKKAAETSEAAPSQQPKGLYWVMVDSELTQSDDEDDGGHRYSYSNEGIVGGRHRMVMNGGFYQDYGWAHCLRYYECSVPPEKFAAESTVSMDLRIIVGEFSVDRERLDLVYCPSTNLELITGMGEFRFKDKNGFDELYTGPNDNRPYTSGNADLMRTFSLRMPPEGTEFLEGMRITLRWTFGGGSYDWTYELKNL